MALKFEITGNNAGLIESLSQSNQAIKDTATKAEAEGKRLSDVFDNIKRSAAGLVAGIGVTEFVKQVANVRGEFQQLEVAFKTMLGSEERANALLGQLVKTAATTPFDLHGVAEGAKQLLAYGIAAEDVNGTLIHLGDIAAGLSIPLNDLVYLYGTTMVQGRMFTQDLRQFQGRGIPIAEEIAKILNITKDAVGEAVTAGKVTSDVLKQAIDNMTQAGGKFGGLMDAQSRTIKGQISNIEDSIDMMFNEIGKSEEGVINTTLGVVSTIVENWKTVGTAIMTVVAAYGEYKASLMVLSAYQDMISKQKATIETERVAEMQSLVDQYEASLQTDSIAAETAATQANTQAKAGNAAVIDQQVAAIEKELTARLASASAIHDAAIEDSNLASQMVESAAERVSAAEAELAAAQASGDAERIAAAEKELSVAQSNMSSAAELKNAAAKEVQTAATAKNTAQQRLNTFQTQVDTVQKNANTKATGLWAAATKMCTTAMHGLKAAMMSNPFGLALVAITSIIGLLSLFSSETDDASDATERFRDKVMKEKQTLDTYYAVLTNVEKGTKSYNDALNGINKLASDYNVAQLNVNDTLEEQKLKYEALTAAIRQQAAEKTIAEAVAKSNEDAMAKEKEAMDELIKQASKAKYTKIEYTTIDAGDGTTIPGYGPVEYESRNIQKITSATWNMISTEVMEHSKKMSDAFAQSAADGEKAVNDEVAAIERILRSLGVTDDELETFHDDLHDYVEDSAKGFSEAYSELDRTKAQLQGIANAAVSTKDVTNEAIDQMNFEQLTSKAEEVQREIDAINAKEVKVQSDNSRLEALKNLLEQINGLLPSSLTAGSDAELNKRLSDLKKKRDSAVYGSDEWTEYNRQVGEVSKTLSTHKKGYAESTTTKKTTTGGKTSKVDRQRQQQRYDELQQQQSLDRRRSAEDLEIETRQAEIDALKDGTEKTLKQLRLDFDKRKKEIERGYEDLKKSKIDKARQLFEADPKNKDKVFDPTKVDVSYTEAETKAYEAQLAANTAEYNRGIEEVNKANIEALHEYMREYGSVEQQKAAISAQYAQKIADEDNAIRKAALEQERDQALEALNFQQLQNDLDWESVFNNLDRVSTEALKGLREKLRGALAAGGVGAEDAQVISQKILEIEDKISDRTSVWSSIIPALRERERLTRAAASAQQEYNRLLAEQGVAETKVQEAQERVQAALKELYGKDVELTDISIEGKLQLFNELGVDATTEAGQRLTDCFDQLQTATIDLTKAEADSAEGKKRVSNANAMLSGSSIGDIFKNAQNSAGGGAMGIINLVNQNAQSLAEFVDKVGLENTDFGDAVHGFADGVAGFQSAITSLASGDIIGAVNGVLDGIAGFGKSFVTIFAGSGNEEEMEARIEELAKANEGLAESIDSLKETIASKDTTNTESVEAYKLAYQAEKDWEKNQREAIDSRAGEYANSGYGFLGLGGKHSFNANMAGNGWEGWAKFTQVLKEHGEDATVNRDTIWNLTPEQMKLLRDFAPEQWASLFSTDGHRNPLDLVNQYIDRAGTLESITSSLNEKLTGYSWEGFRDSFSSILTDMGSDFEAFSDNMEKVLSNAILNSLMTAKYKDRIDALYKMIADAAMDDNITKQEADAIRATNEQIANDMLADRQALLDLGIIKADSEAYQQEASSNGFQAMSQDTGDELNGRFTALQISAELIRNDVAAILTILTGREAMSIEMKDAVYEVRNLIILDTGYLEDVAKYSKKMYLEFNEYLKDIVKNTKNL